MDYYSGDIMTGIDGIKRQLAVGNTLKIVEMQKQGTLTPTEAKQLFEATREALGYRGSLDISKFIGEQMKAVQDNKGKSTDKSGGIGQAMFND